MLNSIRKISAQETYSIRKEVLRKNIDLPFKLKGDLQENTIHIGAFKEGELVGVVSFMKFTSELIKGNQYQLRGMATIPKVRGEGYGRLLIAKGVNLLQKEKIEIIWCNAREIAVEFYKKNGFEIIGESFNIIKVGVHYKMYKRLN